MKGIRYNPEFTRPDGYPFYISSPDPKLREEAIAEARRMNLRTASVPMVPVDFAGAIIYFMNGLPWVRKHPAHPDILGEPEHKPTADDMGNNYAVIKAFRKALDTGAKVVELEDQVHTWLMDTLRREGPDAFHNTQAEVAARLNDLVSERESKTD